MILAAAACAHQSLGEEVKMSRIATLDASKSGRPALADFDVTVSSNLNSCRHAWASLQGSAITTAFQSFDWLDSWQRHVGAAAGVQPVIVTGCRSDGTTAFILPFGLVRKLGCTVLTWLSCPHSNYGYAVYDRTFLERDAASFEQIWTRILTLLPKLDAIALSDQPARVQHYENPFLQLKTCASADRSYILDLDKPFDALLREKFSSRTRRRLAQHERRLDEGAHWRKVDATSDAEIERATNAMFSQKRRQLARRGITDPFSTAFEAFIRSLVACERDGERTVRCYYLECDGEIVATNFGAVENGTYFGLVTTMDEGSTTGCLPVRSP